MLISINFSFLLTTSVKQKVQDLQIKSTNHNFIQCILIALYQLEQSMMKENDASNSMIFDFLVKPYVDPNGWIKVLSRENKQIKLQFKGMLTPQDFAGRLKFKDFGVSNSEETMNTSQSWYFENVKVSALIASNLPNGYPATYLNQQLINTNKVMANVFNGKTPTGTQWSQGYNEGYLQFQGEIKTYGNWNKYWMGWSQNPYVIIGSKTSLRSGGGVNHTGQFIHSGCNGYKDIDHSITSKWDWDNKRVFWIRL